GDAIKTGDKATVSVVYKDGSLSSVDANSQIDIPAPEANKPAPRLLSVLNLLAGKLWMKVAKRQQGTFEVHNGMAVAAVKGTKFQIEVDKDGQLVLTVFEGLVEFKNNLGKLLVGASQQSLITLQQPPSSPKEVDLKDIQTPPTPETTITAQPKSKKLIVQVKDANGQTRTIELEYEK